jgi:hypothetical protein
MRQLGWITRREASKISRLSYRTVTRWLDEAILDAKDGKIPHIELRRVGPRTWYISMRSLQKFLGDIANIKPGSPLDP